MAVSNLPIFPVVIQSALQTFVAVDATTLKTIVTAGTNGTKVELLSVTSTDTAAKDIQLWINDGTTSALLGTASIIATSGFINSAPAISLFNALNTSGQPLIMSTFDSNGNKYLYLKTGWSLKVGTTANVTAAKTIYVTAQYTDF